MHQKISSAQVVCCRCLLTLLTNVSLKANGMEPDQTTRLKGMQAFFLFLSSADFFKITVFKKKYNTGALSDYPDQDRRFVILDPELQCLLKVKEDFS